MASSSTSQRQGTANLVSASTTTRSRRAGTLTLSWRKSKQRRDSCWCMVTIWSIGRGPVDLRFHMNVSKKATNSKRTMNPYKAELSALNKSLRVTLFSETSAGGASIGALPSGDRVLFPIPADAATARPRPRPVVLPPFTPPGGGVGGGLSPSAQAVDRPGVDPGVGVVQRSLPVSAAGAVGAARGGATASSPPVSVAGSAVSLEGGARGRSATTSPMNATELAGRIGMPTGVGGADGTSPIGLSAGTPCFVMPIPACGTLRNIAPTFEVGSALPQPWNPHLPLAATIAQPASKRQAKPCCQECGHLYTTGVYKSPEYHIRTGRKQTCLVKERFPDKVRRPDFEHRAKGRYLVHDMHLRVVCCAVWLAVLCTCNRNELFFE